MTCASERSVSVLRYIDRVERENPTLPLNIIGAALFGYMQAAHDAHEGPLTLDDAQSFVMWVSGGWHNWRSPLSSTP